jgi:prepilin-type N-terminal cleavage/methylation domain-containing protein
MEAVTRATQEVSARDERGFSLVEVLVAMLILTAGLLPLAGLFAAGVQQMGASTPMMIAREKAREAIESVHAARDTGNFTWDTIRNEADGGVFLDAATAIRTPGPDGLVNTDDDGAAQWPDTLYTREIDISTLNIDGTTTPDPNLREVRVIVRYRVNQAWRTYTLVTYISSYS